MNSVDESLLVVGNESDEAASFLVVEQHENFDVALSVVSKVDAAGKASLHDVVQGLERRLIVLGKLELHRPRFRDKRSKRGEQLKVKTICQIRAGIVRYSVNHSFISAYGHIT